jgi:hypothetical protein
LLQDPSKDTDGSIENPELRARIEEMNKQIAEKNKHIDTFNYDNE